VDQAHPRCDVLDLAALERADEVPFEQVPVRVLLGGQLLRAVLAHQRHAALGQCRQVVDVQVLHGRADLDAVAHPLADAVQVRADARGV
jgi:hypothetical protein